MRERIPIISHSKTGVGWVSTLWDGSTCEQLPSYDEGGLCPILVNDVLSGSNLLSPTRSCYFKIVGKLGFGSYSTVWLAENMETRAMIALKVLASRNSNSDNSEMRILRKLGRLEVAFFYTHPPTQNRFLCLGMQPMGSTLRDTYTLQIGSPQDKSSIFIFIKTLMTNVYEFHRRGICHGDISPGNVALGLHREAFTGSALRETFGTDQISPIKLQDYPGKPPHRPAILPEHLILHTTPLKTDMTNMSLVDLIDFGKAFDAPSKKGIFGTAKYRAPEVDHDFPVLSTATAKSDLWSLGCVIVYGLTKRHLFREYNDQENYCAADETAQATKLYWSLAKNRFLENNEGYREAVTWILHTIIRPNPDDRSYDEAIEMVNELEGRIESGDV